MRQWLSFDCHGACLAAALDAADGETGLLIVSGGNEIQSGAHAGMAQLAARIAARGFPTFRFDRRGTGDSDGSNSGYAGSADDIAAAIAAFRRSAPGIRRLVLLGNCDAATAIALFHRTWNVDALILANPWLIEQQHDLPPPAAIRARYGERLRDPRQWLRLFSGRVNIGKLARGVAAISNGTVTDGLAARVHQALATSSLPAHIILARRDATALAFAEHWRSPAFADLRNSGRISLFEIETASHSFARPADAEALETQVLTVLAAVSGGL